MARGGGPRLPAPRTRLPRVREPARTVDDAPVVDPEAIQHAYRLQRARRRARLERHRERRHAQFRFLATLGLLLAASIALGVTVWHQVQRLFGL